MRFGRLLAALLFCGVAACQAAGTRAPSPSASTGTLPSYVDASGMLPVSPSGLPHDISQSGDYRHIGSGLVLPKEANGFRRIDLGGFNADDTDISANYELGSKRAILTVYIFPVWAWADRAYHISEVPAVCAQMFEGMKQAIEYRSKNPSLLREESEATRFPDAALSRAAVYDTTGDKVSGRDGAFRSELHVSCGVGKIWIVQYRISYRQNENMDAVRRDFMAAVPLAPAP
jgi:hypothetical protein